jgi:hypothetical protein
METTGENHPVYLQNPDVVVREVDEDGALLFNPDTNSIRVVNRTGLFIWELCEKGSDLSAMVAGLKKSFDQATEDEMPEQVKTYLAELVQNGFLGQEGNEVLSSESEERKR